MYAFSTTTYTGFQAVMDEDTSEKFRGLPGVVFILPDSYLYPETKEYGGDKYDNGVITPRPPPVHYSKPSRTDRNRNYRGNPQDGPPQQGNYQNSRPPQGGYQNSPPQQGNFQTYRSQQDGRSYPPQQNYAQGVQDARGFRGNDYADRSGYSRPPGGFQGQAHQYPGNPAGQGQAYNNPHESRNFSQGQGGGFRPGGPSPPGSYGQPSPPGSYGQPSPTGSYGQPSPPGNYGQAPPSAYPGGSRVPGVNPSFDGESSQGAGPAYGGDNWQRGSGQYPSPGEGQGNWQGRQ